jgi:hypothetical protein
VLPSIRQSLWHPESLLELRLLFPSYQRSLTPQLAHEFYESHTPKRILRQRQSGPSSPDCHALARDWGIGPEGGVPQPAQRRSSVC